MRCNASRHDRMGMNRKFLNRVTAVLLVGFACLLFEARADRAIDTRTQPATRSGDIPVDLQILPSLKSHMARMGSLMNFLFRNIDELEQSEELLAVIEEMRGHLSLSSRFTPFSMVSLANPSLEASELKRFQDCLTKADTLFAALREPIIAADLAGAKEGLLVLDKLRRDCHAAFG